MVRKAGRKKFQKKGGKKFMKKHNLSAGGSLLALGKGRMWPQRYRTKLVYSEIFNTAITAAAQVDRYRVNNVYDPAYKGGNYGCHGFRQLSLLYSKYICYGSKIEVKAMSNTTSTIQNVSVVPTDVFVNDSDIFATLDGMKYCKTGKMMSIATGGSPESHVSNYITTQELYGLRKNESKYDPSLRMTTSGGTVNGVPFRDGIWNIVLRSGNTKTTADLNCSYNLKITYFVEFYDAYPDTAPTALTQDILDLSIANGDDLYGVLGATGGTGGVGPFITHGETGTAGNIITY